MKQIIIAAFFVFVISNLHAQCTSGNCISGTGTYNYGWCVYTGTFVNGKPEGMGSMQYDDYVYTGHFLNGLEDGEGVIVRKNGERESVSYKAGKKIGSVLKKINADDYRSLDVQDENCLSGNCITGTGTYRFPSGNKYEGEFKDRKREGKGIFYFADGDRFEGKWNNNQKANGTYYFSTGARYDGDYDSQGQEYNGTITSVNGISIPYIKGHPVIPAASKMPMGADLRGSSGTQAKAPAQRLKMPCSVCFGTGKVSRTEDWSNYGAAQGGNRQTYRLERVYISCYKCHGTCVE